MRRSAPRLCFLFFLILLLTAFCLLAQAAGEGILFGFSNEAPCEDSYHDFNKEAPYEERRFWIRNLFSDVGAYSLEPAEPHKGISFPATKYLLPDYESYERYEDWLIQRGYSFSFGLAPDGYTEGHFILMEKADRRLLLGIRPAAVFELTVIDISAMPAEYVEAIRRRVPKKPDEMDDWEKALYDKLNDREKVLYDKFYEEVVPSPFGYQALMNRYAPRKDMYSGGLQDFARLLHFTIPEFEEDEEEDGNNPWKQTFYPDMCFISGPERIAPYIEKLGQMGFEEMVNYTALYEGEPFSVLALEQPQPGGRMFILYSPFLETPAMMMMTFDLSGYDSKYFKDFYLDFGHLNKNLEYRHDGRYSYITGYKGEDRAETELVVPGRLGGYPLRGIDANAFAGAGHLRMLDLPLGVERIDLDAFRGLDDCLIRVLSNAEYQAVAMTGHLLVDFHADLIEAQRSKFWKERSSIEIKPGENILDALKRNDEASREIYILNGFRYQVLKDGTLRVIGYNREPEQDIVVPAELGGYPVTVIGTGAFTDLDRTEEGEDDFYERFVNLTLSEGIREIEEGAIVYHVSNAGMPRVTLPASLSHIAVDGIRSGFGGVRLDIHPDNPNFYYDEQEGYLVDRRDGWLLAYLGDRANTLAPMPDLIRHIPARAFMGLDAIWFDFQLPEGLLSIGDEAFANLPIDHLTLPQSLRSMGRSVIAGTDITTLQLPRNLEVIQGHPSQYTDITADTRIAEDYSTTWADLQLDKRNPYLYIKDNMMFSRLHSALLFPVAPEKVTSYSVPRGTLAIAPSAFLSSWSLTELRLPQGLEMIGDYALPEFVANDLPASLRFLGVFYERGDGAPLLADWKQNSAYLTSGFRLSSFLESLREYWGAPSKGARYIRVLPGSDIHEQLERMGHQADTIVTDADLYRSEESFYSLNEAGEAKL